MGLISSLRKGRVKKRQLRLPLRRKGKEKGEGERGKQCVIEKQMNGCGTVNGELDTSRLTSQFSCNQHDTWPHLNWSGCFT